ncbi:hypothetical protein [Sinorhizobium chiapasense]|uniref:Lipoprotein n=1 Tax=Sinorhizobium chiapasense TaxID=501572 RepID=A0ABZ2B841_9HYPH
MKRAAIISAFFAAFAGQAAAKDASFTFTAKYQGIEFQIDRLSAEECAKLIANPVIDLITEDGTAIIVPANETKRSCSSPLDKKGAEEPDTVLKFIGFPPVNVYDGDRIQMGDGPKVDLNMAAQYWTWEDDKRSYFMVDNLQVTDKKTGKSTCYQEVEKQFSCDVNP